MWKESVVTYPGICLEEQMEIMKHLSQETMSSGQDLKRDFRSIKTAMFGEFAHTVQCWV
jgi:hypothetical protein